MTNINANNKIYKIIKLLGKGKGGYSYLVTDEENKFFVAKQIHHEPCDYYQFGNKLESELNDYNRLIKTGINMPRLIDVDYEHERIIKEYIEGDSIFDLVLYDKVLPAYFEQINNISSLFRKENLNIDYFPTNFIVKNGQLFYIDYECNEYMEEWSFENWGMKYWSKTAEFMEYLKNHNKKDEK